MDSQNRTPREQGSVKRLTLHSTGLPSAADEFKRWASHYTDTLVDYGENMARRVFYSFHYVPDCWRTSQVVQYIRHLRCQRI